VGREQKANEERRAAIRQARDDAARAFVQSYAILTNAMAVTLIITEATGTFTADGTPEAQTRDFTISLAPPEVGLAHMLQGSGLLYENHNQNEKRLIAFREKQAAEQAAALPTPEGMEEGPAEEPAVDPKKAVELLKDEAEARDPENDGGE